MKHPFGNQQVNFFIAKSQDTTLFFGQRQTSSRKKGYENRLLFVLLKVYRTAIIQINILRYHLISVFLTKICNKTLHGLNLFKPGECGQHVKIIGTILLNRIILLYCIMIIFKIGILYLK